jgi:SAM-dependent methyltransferase
MESPVEDHYHCENLSTKIQKALEESGKELNKLLPKDLAAVDQLHTGGAGATLDLMKKTNITDAWHVLDAGCGIGGSSRVIAKTFSCQVTGIDLAGSFIETAKDLTKWCQLSPSIQFEKGSVLKMPFDDNTFDAVLCQQILMNIQDKKTAVKEFYRVLKPGGSLILHEIMQGEKKEILLPVPWADNSRISFLLPWKEVKELLECRGFILNHFSNETQKALAWWQMVQGATKGEKPRPLSPRLVFGSNASFFAANMQTNFQNKCLQCIEAVFKKS